jgi:hypothetical protein
MSGASVICSGCGVDLSDRPRGESCPNCGARARTYQVQCAGSITPRSSLVGMARDGRTGKRLAKIKAATELFHADRVWTRVMRVINWRKGEYHERITDLQTGQVRQEVHEPLSQHQGHGSAKKRGPKRGGGP